MDHTAAPVVTNGIESRPLRLALKDDELCEERIAARLGWSKGSPARHESRRDVIEGHHIALLLAAARQQLRGEAFCGADEVRMAYVALCEEFKRKPRSRATVYRMLCELEASEHVELTRRGRGRATLVYVLDAARVARKARHEGAAFAKRRTTAQLRAAFERWDNEHNVCLVLEGLPGECDEIEALWNIAREAVERLENPGA